MRHYDAFVIGTGTAGETAAGLIRDAGFSVGIADEREYGGTCALRGCQPKKYLVVPSHAAVEGWGLVDRGFRAAPELDWPTMQRSRAEFTDAVPGGTVQGLQERGIDTYHAHCEFQSETVVRCGDEDITASAFIIATGARPRQLPVPGGELAGVSDDFLYLDELPRRIVFIGGGYISMEFATVASACGCEVTIVEHGDRIMKRFDPDLVDLLRQGCASRDIAVLTEATVSRISAGDGNGARPGSGGPFSGGAADAGSASRVELEDGRSVDADLVIAALGRTPNVEDLGLEQAGVQHGRRGITTDKRMRTSAPGIFAAGDCVASIQLSPVSDAEAKTAAQNVIHLLQTRTGPHDTTDPEDTDNGAYGGVGDPTADAGSYLELDIRALPTVVFTYPQLAQVGIDEAEARRRGGVRVEYGSGAGWPNYRRLNEEHMAYKVMVDESSNCILGAHILAPDAGEIINLFALAMTAGIPAARLKEIPWAYPTYLSDVKYMVG
jgi:glutathione reductase (NADPH)